MNANETYITAISLSGATVLHVDNPSALGPSGTLEIGDELVQYRVDADGSIVLDQPLRRGVGMGVIVRVVDELPVMRFDVEGAGFDQGRYAADGEVVS